MLYKHSLYSCARVMQNSRILQTNVNLSSARFQYCQIVVNTVATAVPSLSVPQPYVIV